MSVFVHLCVELGLVFLLFVVFVLWRMEEARAINFQKMLAWAEGDLAALRLAAAKNAEVQSDVSLWGKDYREDDS